MLARRGYRAICLAALPAVAAVSLAWANAAAAKVIESQSRATTVVAHGDTFVWSSFRTKDRRYRLTAWRNGRLQVLPVAPRRVPFDVDLGSGRRGALQAVYSRCKHEPPMQGIPGRPAFRAGRGCRLFRYSFAAKRERVLPVPTRDSVFLPTIDGRRLAYAAVRPRGFRWPPVPRIYDWRIGAAHARLMWKGPRGRSLRYSEVSGPMSVDLRAGRLLVTWSYPAKSFECGALPGEDFPNYEVVTIDRSGDADVLLHGGCAGDGDTFALFGASWISDRRIAFLQRTLGTPQDLISGWKLKAPSPTSRVVPDPLQIVSYAQTEAGRAVAVLFDPPSSYEIRTVEPILP